MSFRQPHAVDEFRESGFRAQAVEDRIDVKPDQLTSVLLIGLLEEGQGSILFSQAGIDNGWIKGRDVAGFRHFLQVAQNLSSFVSLSRLCVGIAEGLKHGWTCFGQLNGSLSLSNRVFVLAFLHQREAEITS